MFYERYTQREHTQNIQRNFFPFSRLTFLEIYKPFYLFNPESPKTVDRKENQILHHFRIVYIF